MRFKHKQTYSLVSKKKWDPLESKEVILSIYLILLKNDDKSITEFEKKPWMKPYRQQSWQRHD